MNLFDCMPVVVSRYLCKFTMRGRQRRTHRRSRINKKYRKKYGYFYECECVAMQCGRELLVCPHAMEKIKQQIPAAKNVPFEYRPY